MTALQQMSSVNPAATFLLPQQQQALFGIHGATAGSPNYPAAQLLLAHQMQEAQQQQRLGSATDQQQQLAEALQQQLLAAGAIRYSNLASDPVLPPTLPLNLQQLQHPASSDTASGSGIPSVFDPSTAFLVQALAQQQQQQYGLPGILHSAALLEAQGVGLQETSTSSLPSSNNNHDNHASPGYAAAQGGTAAAEQKAEDMTGRPPVVVYISCDDDSLSEYQCLVRKQIELFEAGLDDVESNAQGRNKPIVLGQVGIRCRHCSMLPPKQRARGAVYYPAKLHGIYQAAQNMASSHLGEHCQHVPADLRSDLLKLHYRKSSAGGGKKYWADGVRVLGVYEDDDGLRFEKR